MAGIMMPYMGAMGQQGSIVRPSEIASLNLWYDASVANATNFNPVPTDGTVVTAWVDKLGNGRDANQATANRKPLWRANQRNGLGSIQFDGTNDNFTLNPIPWALSLSGQTTYILFRAAALTNNMHIQSTNTGGYKFYLSGSNWAVETGGGVAVSNSGSDTTNYHYMGMIFDGTQTDANTTTQNNLRLKFRYDGSAKTLTFSSNVNTTTSASANTLNIGADSSGSNNYFNGYIAELMIWTRRLNDTEIQQVESYLKTKYNL